MALPPEVCIRGAGIVGRTLALLLARERVRVALVVPPAAQGKEDIRAYALNAASRALLESLRAWPDAAHATAVREMLVHGDEGGRVQFSAARQKVDALAWIVDVPALEQQLADAVRFQPQIEIVAGPVPAPLTVVCEGKASTTREALGALKLTSERAAWPLARAIADRWTGVVPGQANQSWALAGDAAHTVHPLAGQGLNLGLADAATLADVIKNRDYWRSVGDARLLRRYERARRADVLQMSLATDGLQQLFSHNVGPLPALRNWGMRGFDRTRLVKHWIATQAMGLKA
jgi:2-polyprenyl-6-methoxyphenol hydroxylase-like FAD-dependent oxidoreductase